MFTPNKQGQMAEALSSDEMISRVAASTAPMFDIDIPQLPIIKDYKMADTQYKIIMEHIKDFEDQLDDDHEVAIKLASFGQSILLAVVDIGYSNPFTLVFYGYVEGQPATLIQHMSMLNFLLMAVKKKEPDKLPRRIGFQVPSDNADE